MNAKQAKSIPIVDIMEKLGFEVLKVERNRTEFKYLSPFRAEAAPSFNINLVKNSWYDFGEAVGGNTLDFVVRYLQSKGQNCQVVDALEWLNRTVWHNSSGKIGEGHLPVASNNLIKIQQNIPPITEPERDLEFIKATSLQSRSIVNYLLSRKISLTLASKYLVEVFYRNKKKASQKAFYGFAMKNVSGGYELRSASDNPELIFKSALIIRDITIVKGQEEGRKAVSVFEGQLDFLSLLMMLGVEILRGDSIILNALSSYEKAKIYIEQKGYERIDLFLDNDASGKKATQKFRADFAEIEVQDQSLKYASHKDLNDALVANFNPFG